MRYTSPSQGLRPGCPRRAGRSVRFTPEEVRRFLAAKKGNAAASAATLDEPAVPKLLTLKEAAELLRCDPRTLRRWTSAGLVPRVKLGGSVLYDEADLAAFVQRQKETRAAGCAASQKGGQPCPGRRVSTSSGKP